MSRCICNTSIDGPCPQHSPRSRNYAALQQGIRSEPDRRIPGDGDGAFAGSKLVPSDPTPEMLKAAEQWEEPEHVYRAMVEAAPRTKSKSAVNLVLRAQLALRAWHRKYGEHQPQWLPPAHDVRWLEDADAFLAEHDPPTQHASANVQGWPMGGDDGR